MAFTKEEWWHVDQQGRRIGWMWPEDMEAILDSFYGHRKWTIEFSERFGYARSTVDRWRHGMTPIPKNVAQIIQMIGTFKVRGIPMDYVEATWLPESTGANGRRAGKIDK